MFQALRCRLKYAKYAARVFFLNETKYSLSGPIAQSVVCLIADPGIVSLILAQPHTFVEANREKIAAVILLLQLIQEGLLSVTWESMCKEYSLVKLTQKKSVARLTDHFQHFSF